MYSKQNLWKRNRPRTTPTPYHLVRDVIHPAILHRGLGDLLATINIPSSRDPTLSQIDVEFKDVVGLGGYNWVELSEGEKPGEEERTETIVPGEICAFVACKVMRGRYT
jgi:hypothetical protein